MLLAVLLAVLLLLRGMMLSCCEVGCCCGCCSCWLVWFLVRLTMLVLDLEVSWNGEMGSLLASEVLAVLPRTSLLES